MNFSRHHVAFPSEADAALGFLFTLCAKTKSKIRLIRQSNIYVFIARKLFIPIAFPIE
jgi:hypothetical protein